jgi:mannose-6-phosphate isomerase
MKQCCAESWEISDHDNGMSVVETGAFAGQTLREIVQHQGDELFGTGRSYTKFPILIKLIDAKDRLSVQVHPNEKTAPLTGGDPKTEMWVGLDGDADASVYAGLATGTTPDVFGEHIKTGEMDSVLRKHSLKSGEVIFIPGGLVHAIDRGCFLLEVQQNSDTTYRLWDWGRVEANGKPRELHIDQAMRSIDWQNDRNPCVAALPPKMLGKNSEVTLIANDFFVMKSYAMTESQKFDTQNRCFDVLFTAKGAIRIVWGNEELTVDEGRSVLIPAALGMYHIEPLVPGTCETLYVTMP